MSVPAKKLPDATTSPARTASRPSPSARPRTAGRPSPQARPRTAAAPRPRRGFHTAFWLFAAAVITLLLIGVVSISAMVVQTSMQVAQLQTKLADLSDSHERLATQAAELSAPGRLAEWARDAGMVSPDGVVIVQVPGEAGR